MPQYYLPGLDSYCTFSCLLYFSPQGFSAGQAEQRGQSASVTSGHQLFRRCMTAPDVAVGLGVKLGFRLGFQLASVRPLTRRANATIRTAQRKA